MVFFHDNVLEALELERDLALELLGDTAPHVRAELPCVSNFEAVRRKSRDFVDGIVDAIRFHRSIVVLLAIFQLHAFYSLEENRFSVLKFVLLVLE